MAKEKKPRSDANKAWRIILLLFVAALPAQMLFMGISRGNLSVIVIMLAALLFWWGLWYALLWRR